MVSLWSFIKKLFVEEKKRVIVTRLDEEGRIEDIDKAVQKDLAFKEGEIAEANARIKEFEDEKVRKDVDKEIAEKLVEKEREFGRLNYKGGLSLKSFFKRQLEQKKTFDVLSYDEQKNFGLFNDLIILPDGMLAVQVRHPKDEKKRNILMVGSSANLLFSNFKGLKNSVARGCLRLNLTADNEYYYNPLDEMVPKVIYVDGKSVQLGKTQEYLVQQLADLHQENTEIIRQLTVTEDALAKEISKRKTMTLGSQLNQVRAEAAEHELSASAASVSGMTKVYHQIMKESAHLSTSLKISEDRADNLEDVQDETLKNVREYLKKPEFALAKEQIEDISNELIRGFVRMSLAYKNMPMMMIDGEEKKKVENKI